MNVYQKIGEVMAAVKYLVKDDSIAFGNTKYKAISEEKVTVNVRQQLIKSGLVILPIKQEHKKEGNLSSVDVTYRIVNTEEPDDYVDVVSSGTGADSQDKGVGKAMTYSYKYMLLRTFAIPTGEDPDKISSAELDSQDGQVKAGKVSKAHLEKLNKEIERTGTDVRRILYTYKLKALKEMHIGQFNDAMALLKQIEDAPPPAPNISEPPADMRTPFDQE